MTLDGLITFLTLLIGGYALLPSVRRIQLRLAAPGIVWWSLLASAGVLYFQFFDLLALPCPANLGPACGWTELGRPGSMTPQQAAFLVVLAWLLLLLWRLRRHKLRDRDMPNLSKLSRQLVEEDRVNELLDLTQPYLTLIDDCARRERPFQKYRDRLARDSARIQLEQLLVKLDGEISAPPPIIRLSIGSKIKAWIGNRLPDGTREEEAANDVLRLLLKEREVVEHICKSRPGFAARLLSLQSYRVNDFSDRMLQWMVEHPESTFYEEIQQTQNLLHGAYQIPEHNALLHALFVDAEVATQLDAYRPVAEAALARLNPANDPAYCRSLNLPYDVLWDERGRWRDTTYATIRYFDIMVRAAASQNVQWHMWLYYMPHVVKWLEKTYTEDAEGVDATDEWPTRCAALLYEIVAALREWIQLAGVLGENSVHREPENDRVDHENGNIPKSAAIALGMCVNTIVMSDRIGDRFKGYILGVALRTVNEMPAGGTLTKLRRVILESIAQGGVMSGGDPYQERLVDLYREIEQPWHHDVDDFEAMIGLR